jgi:hypothetical protein
MWCCVGTGMENHSKYGHFVFTHDGKKTLYVNLFTSAKLQNKTFAVTQTTRFPFEPKTTITIDKAGKYDIAIRHPEWVSHDFAIKINGQPINFDFSEGKAFYVTVTNKWKKGDVIEVSLPMTLRYEECPNYGDYIAFKYGPILLGANTTQGSEKLQNEYGFEGRMDHSPGAMGKQLNLLSAPLLIGARADVLNLVKPLDLSKLTFTIDAKRPGVGSYKWNTLTLQPFYQIHHDRYMCYWYQQTPENFAKSDMAKTEARNEELIRHTVDFVAAGEQQSEAGHEYNYSSDSNTGLYRSERYRDARANGHIQYTLVNQNDSKDLRVMLRFNLADKGRMAVLTINDKKVADITIPATVEGAEPNGFFEMKYDIPAEMVSSTKRFVVRLTASPTTLCPGLYYLRLYQK